jgi:hypothetical protein
MRTVRLGISVVAVAVLCATLLTTPASARAPVSVPMPVPPEYQSLYGGLRAWLGASFPVRPAARQATPVWGAHLIAADSNRGPVLLEPATLVGVELMLDRFKELGIQGVSVAIGYPLLTPSFDPQSSQYIDFYRAVAAIVRARGMKFSVEQIVLYNNSNFSPWTFDLSGVSMQQMIDDNRQMAQTIIDQLHPDYLTIMHEPDTFALLTGKSEFLDANVAVAYVRGVLEGLNRGSTKVGAGSGTWSGPSFANGIVQTTVDYLDIHIYWVNGSSVLAGKEMVALARAYGKPVVIDEAWLYKSVGEGIEGLPGLAGNEKVYRRDVFSFFEPLDRKFLTQTARFAKTAGAVYFAPYWSNYFFAYLNYEPFTQNLPYKELVTVLAPQAVEQAIISDRFTKTGKHYASIIRHNG